MQGFKKGFADTFIFVVRYYAHTLNNNLPSNNFECHITTIPLNDGKIYP